MKNKHCEWCDHTFETKISYQIYCSPECREAATKEKISARYQITRIKKRSGKIRNCKSCGNELSIYNDDSLCQGCEVNPSEVSKILKEIRGLGNGKDWTN
jgi:hypothetical protein